MHKLFKQAFPKVIMFLGLLLFVWTSTAEAGPRKKRRNRLQKRMNITREIIEPDFTDFQFRSEINKVVKQSADTDLYDPLTIESLRRLRDDYQPRWDPDDIDPVRTRRAVTKAFSIQLARSISRLVKGSELRGTYHLIREKMKEFRNSFRYSIQDSGDTFSISKKKRGRKLLEFNVEINSRTLLDPQLVIGDRVRFRYDFVQKAPLIDFQFRF